MLRILLARWLPRGWMRATGFALLIIVLLVFGAAIGVYVFSSLSIDQRISAVAAIFTAGAFLLAALAAVVALVGFGFLIRHPTLGMGYAGSTISIRGNRREYTMTMHMGNTGAAVAMHISVMLSFQRATILSAQEWLVIGNTARWNARDIAIHVGAPSVPLPPITVEFAADDNEVTADWVIDAERVHVVGMWYVNPASTPFTQPPPMQTNY